MHLKVIVVYVKWIASCMKFTTIMVPGMLTKKIISSSKLASHNRATLSLQEVQTQKETNSVRHPSRFACLEQYYYMCPTFP